MELDLNETNPLHNIIQQIIFNDNLLSKLKATDVVVNALNETIKDKTNAKAFQKYIHILFGNYDFMRKLKYISKISENVEVELEYTGADYISSPDFIYDVEFEKKIVDIEKRLAKFLGSLLKEFSKGVEIEL